MEWLFLSLVNGGYWGNAHLIWYDDAEAISELEQALKEAIRQQAPTFLYRVGERTPKPANARLSVLWQLQKNRV